MPHLQTLAVVFSKTASGTEEAKAGATCGSSSAPSEPVPPQNLCGPHPGTNAHS